MISLEKIFNTIHTTLRLIVCFIGMVVFQENAFTQISEGGIPPSFQYQTLLRSRSTAIQIPVDFDVNELIKADEIQSAQGPPILTVAKLIDVQLNQSNAGAWSTLPDGTKIWQLNLQAQGAIALILYYSDFNIPEGGKLFIYNADKTHILGAYTKQTNPASGRFATEFVAGDALTLEYVASSDDEMPRIEIEAIGYGYNNLTVRNSFISLRAAAACEVNVNCEEGDVWQNQKKGVTKIIQRIGGYSVTCTGSLLNNTAQDLKPYILTAQHCACNKDVVASPEDMEQWVFYFHYERAGCSNSSSISASKSITGCSKIAETNINKESDGLLLLLKMSIPENYQVYYNGWDRRNIPARSGVGIHHPQGDYKKISTFFKPAEDYTFPKNSDVPSGGDTNAHWNARFDETINGHGVTDNGSSGSPLFNENKLIVGTLSGGNSSCSYPNGLNLYGKLNYHWDKYTYSDSVRMDIWLDPIKSGVQFLQGRFYQASVPAPSNLKANVQNQTVVLTWNAPASTKPSKYNVYNNQVRIGESTGLTFTDKTPLFGAQTYSISAVYTNGNESDLISESVTVIEYKAPTNVTVTQTTSQQVAVLWDLPVYEQTIYWGESSAVYQVKLNGNSTFYFGQTWSKSEIQPFHKRTMTAVKFVPIRNNTYEIVIVQGNRTYRQAVSNTVAGRTNTIELTTPFVINGAENLIVSFQVVKVSTSADDYPAVCDGGPAVQGKGNIYSLDGQNWKNLYDENRPNEFNYNFFIAAVVSSVEKDIPVTTNGLWTQRITFSYFSTTDMRIALLPEEISLRSIRPASFPEPTGYVIYRDNGKIATVPPVPRRYVDVMPSKESFYQVSAIYQNSYESHRSDSVGFKPTDISSIEPNDIRIHPIIFSNQIELIGYENINRVEVFSATGILSLRIENPDKIIDVGFLRPGVYFFRIYTDYNRSIQVLRGLKQRQ